MIAKQDLVVWATDLVGSEGLGPDDPFREVHWEVDAQQIFRKAVGKTMKRGRAEAVEGGSI